MPSDVYARLVTLAKSRSIPSIVDATGDALIAAAAAGATIVKPNARELAEATGFANPREAVEHLRRLGVTAVFASLGEKGMLATDATTFATGILPAPLNGNPTGAGDAAVASLAVSLQSGIDDITAMLVDAIALASSAVTMPYAGDVTEDYRLYVPQIRVSVS
jgi:fructose-1-phosphate kinase PfkB-like protein